LGLKPSALKIEKFRKKKKQTEKLFDTLTAQKKLDTVVFVCDTAADFLRAS
jgi:hypothetical protein|tara:strand:- start:547 stop:699 length:153 start_codon:yes stop_codon:yes gene_type:complete